MQPTSPFCIKHWRRFWQAFIGSYTITLRIIYGWITHFTKVKLLNSEYSQMSWAPKSCHWRMRRWRRWRMKDNATPGIIWHLASGTSVVTGLSGLRPIWFVSVYTAPCSYLGTVKTSRAGPVEEATKGVLPIPLLRLLTEPNPLQFVLRVPSQSVA